MAEPVSDAELARLVRAHQDRLLALQAQASEAMGRLWDDVANVDATAARAFSTQAAELAGAYQEAAAELTHSYLLEYAEAASGELLDVPGLELENVIGSAVREGANMEQVYERGVVTARSRLADGAQWADAMRAGRARATLAANTDVKLADRASVRETGRRGLFTFYRRVLDGDSCLRCAAASTQRYHREDLLPIHPGCGCTVAPIIADRDPGRVLNEDLLAELKENGGSQYWERQDVRIDANGKVTTGAPGSDKRETFDVAVGDHGELGPLLGTPSEVRRYTETNIRRRPRGEVEADRALEAADSLDDLEDLAAIADELGVPAHYLEQARDELENVRKEFRAQAKELQYERLKTLDSADALKLDRPPRAKWETNADGRRRRTRVNSSGVDVSPEWEWYDNLGTDEQKRLNRWLSPKKKAGQLSSSTPDQVHDRLTRFGIIDDDASLDEAMDWWLRQSREVDSLGRAARGKLSSADADIDALLPPVGQVRASDVLNVHDDTAALNIAKAWAQEADDYADQAYGLLGYATEPIHGPKPYRMSLDSFEDEVRSLEYVFEYEPHLVTGRDRDRYAELVPSGLDADGLPVDELYARIIDTARAAGEDVPSYARIF